jgi:hypothetical protein
MQFKFFTGGALAALAAALALTAVPASAREADHKNNGQHTQRWGGRDQPTARPDRAAPQAQRDRSSTPQARPQQAPQQQQRNWTRQDRPQQPQQAQAQRGWTSRGNWSAPTREQQQRTRTPQAQQTQRWAGNDQRTERNRTYTNRERTTTYRNSGTQSRDGRRDGNRNWRDGNRDGRRWDRNWHNNNRYDWQRYRSTNRNVFHIGRYYSPYRNYSYRRLSIGFGLDSLFYSNRYWINDPWQYRLPEAYGPYRWVRYYDDALLVDIYSGEVVDVIYDFFW